ncbi:MAG: putative nucleotidyltransferase substrate binding domain-containing protein [Geminicoccaceae bacterium]
MDADNLEFQGFASRHLPLGLLSEDELGEAAKSAKAIQKAADDAIYEVGDKLDGLYVIRVGEVEIISPEGETLQRLATGDSFGERGLLREGKAPNRAVAVEDSLLFLVPRALFNSFIDKNPSFKAFFHPKPKVKAEEARSTLTSTPIKDLMTPDPITIGADRPVKEAADIMREQDISCLPVISEGLLVGILTSGDLVDRVIAEGLGTDVEVGQAMTPDPFTLHSDALGFDALLAMTERSIGHLPIVDDNKLVGILTASNLVRRQSISSVFLVAEIKKSRTIEELAAAVERLPDLLVRLVASGVLAHDVGRLITGVADALTRRLVTLAQVKFGSPPVPYLWLACGSQGRQEQTGVSDQDNCLFLGDGFDAKAHGGYFEKLARFVSDGLDACGYYFCPGDMMATNPRWRQPVHVWKAYFAGWIREPDPMAQMLASVMFDLRPIAGDEALFEGVHAKTLKLARKNSIFRAHMVSNSLKHTPPLSLFRGFALIRSGEHKNTLDLKLNGVVPIVDLGRIYTLEAGIEEANTRERLILAQEAGKLSEAGFRDLIDAYDLIATMRLRHQAEQIRAGKKPDNFLPPSQLSDLERNHLREAFTVVKTLQSTLAHRRGIGA